MDARTNITSRLLRRHMTVGTSRGASASVMGSIAAQRDSTAVGQLLCCKAGFVEIFKKTPYGTGLKRVSRYVAKDILEVAVIPSLKTLLDRGRLQGDRLAAAERLIAESSKAVKWNPRQDVFCSADKPITCNGDLVGLKGNPASDLLELQGVRTSGRDACLGAFNVKLTDMGPAAHTTREWRRATNQMSGTLWTYARQVMATIGGATIRSGRTTHETYCYAKI